jgi:hypothetical protein
MRLYRDMTITRDEVLRFRKWERRMNLLGRIAFVVSGLALVYFTLRIIASL